MDRHRGTAKMTVALVAFACLALIVAFVAPPVARIAIALVALPLTVTIVAAIAPGTEQNLPRA
jgi:hypothetical protein